MTASVAYVGLDGSRLEFDIPKNVNKRLIVSAVKKIHQGADPDMAVRCLTRPELDLVLTIVGTLEDHRLPVAV